MAEERGLGLRAWHLVFRAGGCLGFGFRVYIYRVEHLGPGATSGVHRTEEAQHRQIACVHQPWINKGALVAVPNQNCCSVIISVA